MVDIDYLKNSLPESPTEFLYVMSYTNDVSNMVYELLKTNPYREGVFVTENKTPRRKKFPITQAFQYNFPTKIYRNIIEKNCRIRFIDDTREEDYFGWAQRDTVNIRFIRTECPMQPESEDDKLLTTFLRQNEDKKVTYRKQMTEDGYTIHNISSERITTELVHQTRYIVPLCYEEYVREKEPEIQDIMLAIFSKDPKYKEMLIAYAEKNNNPETIIMQAIKQKIAGKIRSYENNISHLESQIKDLFDRAETIIEEKQKQENMLLYEKTKLESTTDISNYTEVLNFAAECFKTAKFQLSIVNNEITYEAQGTSLLQVFDEEIAQRIYNKARRQFTDPNEYVTRSWEWVQAFKKIFIDKELIVNTSFAFQFFTERYNATSNSYARLSTDTIPHPHLTSFNCWGNHRSALLTYKTQDDMIGAISQCMYATSQINLLDSTVLNRCIDDIIRNYCKRPTLIDTKTGLSISWEEYKEHYELEEEPVKEANNESTEDVTGFATTATATTTINATTHTATTATLNF